MASRAFARAVRQGGSAWRRTQRVLLQPARWPWTKLAVLGAGCATVTGLALEAERRRQASLCERRVFNGGSPLGLIADSLRTGDVLLFNRTIFDPSHASVSPTRMATVMLQKLHGRCEYDHVGVVVLRHGCPHILERGPSGTVTLRTFESRILHSSSKEIVLRRLNAPPMTDEDEARVEAWVEEVLGQKGVPHPRPLLEESLLPPLPTGRLFRHLLAAYWFPRFGTTSPAQSTSIASLGHLLELSSELGAIDRRISELLLKSGETELKPVSALTGSTSPLQRMQVRRQGVQMRWDDLMHQITVDSFSGVSTATATPPLTPAQQLAATSDFPSAALVAQTLQVIGVLPTRGAQPYALTHDLTLPADRIPLSSAYPTRQFLSSSSLPLAYRPPQIAAGDPALQTQVDCFLDREMFVRSKNRPLAYTVEEFE